MRDSVVTGRNAEFDGHGQHVRRAKSEGLTRFFHSEAYKNHYWQSPADLSHERNEITPLTKGMSQKKSCKETSIRISTFLSPLSTVIEIAIF